MQSDYDGSASGYIVDFFEGVSQEFTDVEILSTSETNTVARAKRYGRWWLLKGLNSRVANETAYLQRLRKEFELLMQLQYPSVVATFGIEQVDGLGKCIIMEYIDGITLKEWLQGKHSIKECRRIALEIADAVRYVHSKGIVHRDLKPENIIITTNGDNVKLVDFGLADTDSYTLLKQPAGTRKYMSPEQMQASVADVRNDIYSLGVIFSQMKLGYGNITKRCQLPIDCRYQNVSELINAILKRNKFKSIYTWGTVLVTILMLAGISIVQSQRVSNLSKQMDRSQEKQTRIQSVISSLNDSLKRITIDNRVLFEEQQAQKERRKNIEDAIINGKAVIDRALRASGIIQHLDTLKNFAYLRMDIFNRISVGEDARNQYVNKIRTYYTENEIAEITNALVLYNGNTIKELMNTYTKLKDAHEKAIMQGY